MYCLLLLLIAVATTANAQSIEWRVDLSNDRFIDQLLFSRNTIYATGRDHLFEVSPKTGAFENVFDHTQGQVVSMKAYTTHMFATTTTHYILSLMGNKNLIQFDPLMDENRWVHTDLVALPVIEQEYGIIYTLSSGNIVKALHSMTGRPIWSVQCCKHQGSETSTLQLSRDEQTLYVITSSGNVYGYNAATGVPEKVLTLPNVKQTFLVDQYLYGWSSNSKRLMVFDLADGKLVGTHDGIPGKSLLNAKRIGSNKILIETTEVLAQIGSSDNVEWIYTASAKDHSFIFSEEEESENIFLVEHHHHATSSTIAKIDSETGQTEWELSTKGHCIDTVSGNNALYFVTMKDDDVDRTARLHLPRGYSLEAGGGTQYSTFELVKVAWGNGVASRTVL